jgi:hypothetical protein
MIGIPTPTVDPSGYPWTCTGFVGTGAAVDVAGAAVVDAEVDAPPTVLVTVGALEGLSELHAVASRPTARARAAKCAGAADLTPPR